MVPAAVIFDLDDTLVAESLVAEESIAATARLVPGADPSEAAKVIATTANKVWRAGPFYELGVALGIVSWEGLWATFEGNHPRLEGLRAWAPTYRHDAWTAILSEFGIADAALALELSESFVALQHRGHPLLLGAAELVRGLHGHCRLGLLTNGPADIQRLKFEESGLGDFFDAVVISGELGVGKPEPAVFEFVLDQLEATPDDAVMIGDSWKRDICGAAGVAMGAIWLSGGAEPPEHRDGVQVVEAIAQVAALPLWGHSIFA